MRAVIVGAGPSGFYAADQLLTAGFEVDLIDALPTPFGLVRAGVAPDHPKIKSVTRMYEKTAAKPGFRFFGGVRIGEHISRAELLEHYHVASEPADKCPPACPLARARSVCSDGLVGGWRRPPALRFLALRAQRP